MAWRPLFIAPLQSFQTGRDVISSSSSSVYSVPVIILIVPQTRIPALTLVLSLLPSIIFLSTVIITLTGGSSISIPIITLTVPQT